MTLEGSENLNSDLSPSNCSMTQQPRAWRKGNFGSVRTGTTKEMIKFSI